MGEAWESARESLAACAQEERKKCESPVPQGPWGLWNMEFISKYFANCRPVVLRENTGPLPLKRKARALSISAADIRWRDIFKAGNFSAFMIFRPGLRKLEKRGNYASVPEKCAASVKMHKPDAAARVEAKSKLHAVQGQLGRARGEMKVSSFWLECDETRYVFKMCPFA